KRLDDFHHVLPWQNLLHAGQENLFSGLTALTAEFTVGEGKLIVWRWYSPDSCPQKGVVIRLQTG
ncbi:hypothetical protein, partial [Aeromonas caviae]|uniref:hypothetical protein n=1 Tax=Aeromonas caviae TaxID=648 RepID=UPI00398A6230